MILVDKLPELNEEPFTERIDSYTESEALDLLHRQIAHSRQIFCHLTELFKGEWTNNPSTNIRAVFGSWFIRAMRHFGAITILCEEKDFSVVANIHQRQIFEIFLQIKYFASLSEEEKEKNADIIRIYGCLDYLEKLEKNKSHEYIKKGYDEIFRVFNTFDRLLVAHCKGERKKRKYNWFGVSFSKLAEELNEEGEDLKTAYMLFSSDLHGTWDLLLDVQNPEPGKLDFRGYPDKKTLYIRTVEMLHQVSSLMMNLWNEIAKSVGAEEIFYR